MGETQTEERTAEQGEILAAIQELATGREKEVMELLPQAINALAFRIQASTGRTCPVCEEGELHYLMSREVLLQGLGSRSRAGEVLMVAREFVSSGSLMVRQQERIGTEIPTLRQMMIVLPIYICTNTDCLVFVLHNVLNATPTLEE